MSVQNGNVKSITVERSVSIRIAETAISISFKKEKKNLFY
jgi:hypothetical protein